MRKQYADIKLHNRWYISVWS